VGVILGIISQLPLCKGGKAESFTEGIQKSSPPFEKGGREGYLGMPFQKAK
jgi:hypothetical protein